MSLQELHSLYTVFRIDPTLLSFCCTALQDAMFNTKNEAMLRIAVDDYVIALATQAPERHGPIHSQTSLLLRHTQHPE